MKIHRNSQIRRLCIRLSQCDGVKKYYVIRVLGGASAGRGRIQAKGLQFLILLLEINVVAQRSAQ